MFSAVYARSSAAFGIGADRAAAVASGAGGRRDLVQQTHCEAFEDDPQTGDIQSPGVGVIKSRCSDESGGTPETLYSGDEGAD